MGKKTTIEKSPKLANLPLAVKQIILKDYVARGHPGTNPEWLTEQLLTASGSTIQLESVDMKKAISEVHAELKKADILFSVLPPNEKNEHPCWRNSKVLLVKVATNRGPKKQTKNQSYSKEKNGLHLLSIVISENLPFCFVTGCWPLELKLSADSSNVNETKYADLLPKIRKILEKQKLTILGSGVLGVEVSKQGLERRVSVLTCLFDWCGWCYDYHNALERNILVNVA